MTFDIFYHGRKLYQNLTHEECAEILDDLSQRYYEDEDFDVNQLELKEHTYG